jgi:hypothetical protein
VVVVKGVWIYDSLHDGWNEIHAVQACQIIGRLEEDLGWAGFSYTDASTGTVFTFEEGTHAQWLFELARPLVEEKSSLRRS